MVEEDTLITKTVYVEYDYYIIKEVEVNKYLLLPTPFLMLLRGSMVAFFCYYFFFVSYTGFSVLFCFILKFKIKISTYTYICIH